MAWLRRGAPARLNIFRRAASYVKQHNFLMPAILAFACFIIVVLLAISVWFSTSVSSNLEDAVYEVAAQQSAMGAETLRLTLDGFGTLSGWISELDQVTPRAYRASSYKAFEAFKDYDLPVFRFSNLILYYGRDVMMLSVRGTSWPQVRFPNLTDHEAFLTHLDGILSKQMFCTMDYGADYTQNTLIVAYRLPNHVLALFTLEYADLYNLIAPNMHSTGDTSLRILTDGSGHVLWANTALSADITELILNSGAAKAPQRKFSIDDTDYLYSSAAVTGGLTLLTLDMVTTQFDAVNRAIGVLVTVCVILLVLGILLLVFGIQRSSTPIVQLVTNIRESLPQQKDIPVNVMDALRQVCSQYSRLVHESTQQNALLSNEELRDLFILRIICGQYADPEELTNLCHWLNVELPYRHFVSCLMLFEAPPTEAERSYIKNNLRRMTGENYACCFCLTPDGRSAVGMVNLADSRSAGLRAFGKQLLNLLSEHTSVTIGLGQAYESIDALGRSYLEAHTALEQRLIHGKNTCILYNDIPASEAGAPSVYPKQELDSYLACLRQWDASAIQQELDKIIRFIHENALPLQQVKCICFELTASLLREINRMGSLTSSLDRSMFDVFSIAEYASVNELADNIVKLSQNVQQCIENRKNRRKDDLIAQCQQCIQENISNPQFSLGLLADQFEVTPQTLRRNFKEATGQTLSNYLISLRIERAKQLLAETDLNLSNICVQCGYIDVSNFARLFKSEVGMSPGVYRENHLKQL